MKQLRKFLRLSARDRLFFIKSACLVSAIRLGLWVLPFRRLQRLLDGVAQVTTETPTFNQMAINRIVWAVKVTSRYVPRASCLTQALAAQVLLSQHGYLSHLRLGVIKDKQGQLEAHAWVECNGHIIIGGVESPQRYSTFPLLEGKYQ